MKVFAVLALAFAAVNGFVVPATTLVRAPSHDSAVIQSDRLGGNFAYSVNEAHAYAAVSPVVKTVATPVGVSYSTPYAYAPYSYPYAPFATVVPADDAKEAKPVEVKTLPYAAYPYSAYPYSFAPFAAPFVAAAEDAKEAKPVEIKTLPYAAYPYGYGYGYHGYPFAAASPFVTYKAAEKSE